MTDGDFDASGAPADTVLLVNDTSEVCHWGCTATSTALKVGIAARGYTLDVVPASGIPRLGSLIACADDFDNDDVQRRLYEKAPTLSAQMETAQTILINAEGCLHGDRNVAKTLLYIAWYAAVRLGKPVDLVNHSCYPQDSLTVVDDDLLVIYRRTYAAVRFVAVREPPSHRLVQQWLRAEAKLSFDCLPLYVKAHGPEPGRTRRRAVTFASSVIWQRAWAAGLVDIMAQLASAGREVRILTGANGDLNHEDRAFMGDIRRAWRRRAILSGRFWQPSPWRVVEAQTMDVWLATIAESRLLVSGRFHHSIAAACMGTPRIMLDSNTPKIEGVLEVLGETAGPRYGEPGWADALWRRIEAALAQPVPQAAVVARQRERLCELAQVNFHGLDRASVQSRIS